MECRAISHLALHLDFSAESFHCVLHDGQSDAGADIFLSVFRLIERFEDMLQGVSLYSAARITDVEIEHVVGTPCDDAHLARLGSELHGVRQQVVHHLAYVVGYEVHCHLVFLHILQCDSFACGIGFVSLHYHLHVGTHVSVGPFRIADVRLYLRNVENLVDEREQVASLLLYRHHLLPAVVVQIPFVLRHVVAQTEDQRQRSAEFVGDVGEEVLLHLHVSSLHGKRFSSCLQCVCHHQRDAEQQHGGGGKHPFLHSLFVQVLLVEHPVLLLLPLVQVAVQLFDFKEVSGVHRAVLNALRPGVAVESLLVVAVAFV